MAYEKNIITTDKAPAAVGTYSQGVEFQGVYYFSGQIGLNPADMKMAEGMENQLIQILKNIDGLLEHCQIDRTHIFKTTIFLKSMDDFPIVNKHYEEYFAQPYPARSCVEVPRLPKDALVEIEVIAKK